VTDSVVKNNIILRRKQWSHTNGAHDFEIGSPNLPLLKQLARTLFCLSEVKKWLKNSDVKSSIMIYSTYLPYLLAVKYIPQNTKITLIVTDLPEYYDLTVSSNIIKSILRSIYNRLIYSLLERVDSFVILTGHMKEPLNIGDRPSVVIEGLVSDDCNTQFTDAGVIGLNKKTILYTGTLNYKFGIRNLLEAFTHIKDNNYRLWICGSGEAFKEIISMSKIDDRIKYFGYVTKDEVFKLQQQATLLINPRTNDGEYTRYSFPSKTLEYMLSGKPVLMYKLDGIPDDYDQFLYYFGSNQVNDITKKIVEICEKPQHELDELGQKARKFVLENKNNRIQAKKIIDMMNTSEKLV